MAGRLGWLILVTTVGVLAGCQASVVITSPSASLGLTASPTGSPPPPSTTPSATPRASQPIKPVPPSSTLAWSGLEFAQLAGEPEISMVVPWSDGYVALGQTSPTGPLGAWLSQDGRSWTELPDTTFGLDDPAGNTFVIGGTACGSGVLMVGEDASGKGTLWWSDSGTAWQPEPDPRFTVEQVEQALLAGGPSGAVAAIAKGPAVEVTPDCRSWSSVALPGSGAGQVSAVAAIGHGYVALDSSSPNTRQPHAWWSDDARHWTAASVQAAPGDDFTAVWPGISGVMAESTELGLAPGRPSLWFSSDGRAWKVSQADPFGVVASGEGSGNPAGSFAADGTRLVGWGSKDDSSDDQTEYWTSFDGQHWTKLAQSGSQPLGLAGARQVFLMRDGILVSGDAGTWFGSATTR